ncbi:MAG: caspase family protein [Dysgonamonadaceae bacterium]|jgi:hypothetical protein|nr:caspase family protein [Dysgonamonadaceae bacterium]
MKHRVLIFFILLLCCSVYAQTNRALLVAVDRYPEHSGWAEIHASNDIRIITPLLIQNGYKPENIHTLLNKNATKSSILKALNRIRTQSAPGDYIYIHFSCHGQSMIDDNGDEPDGLDEALIPYDALHRFSKGIYEGENHLRDDELEKYLDRIRKKITATGNLTVLLDACHSGTGTRKEEDEYVRGTAYIFGPDNDADNRKNTDAGKDTMHRAPTITHNRSKNLAPITVFCACQPDEINYEYRDNNRIFYGTLSYAFCEILQTSSAVLTGIQFAEVLQHKIQTLSANRKRKQTPCFETTNEHKPFHIGR